MDGAAGGAGDEPVGRAAAPLAGILVVDLTTARSGPTCVRQLVDLGATAIQVGAPGRADLPGSDGWNLHRGKRSVLLDLRTPAGREALLRLVDRADVLVENYRPGVKHRLGLDPATLLARNPRLVYASLSGFGQDGPYADRPGVDQIAQGLSGLMSVTGPPGTGPWRTGIAVSDSAAGTFLAQGVLAALFARTRTGRGQWVHTSLLESLVNLMDFQAARWLNEGDVPAQVGNDHPTFFPMGTYRTADGWVNISGVGGFDRLCAALGAPELAADPRFAGGAARAANRAALDAELRARLAARPTAEWVAAFDEAQLPCGPVLAVDQVFDDPQVRHLDLVVDVPHPDGAGEVHVLRHPVTLTATPTGVPGGPPRPGADTRAVLGELGYTPSEVDDLLAAGAAAEQRRPGASFL